MKVNYIIPAGGVGNRFGSEIPKQFIKLAGIPIIIRTLKALRSHRHTSRIIVALHENWKDHFEKLLLQWDIEGIEITNGGETRYTSIQNAISLLGENTEYIAIHDAVRPMISNSLLDRLTENLELSDTSIPLLPVSDTIKKVDEESGEIIETIDRSQLRAAQTPQMFKYEIYLKALDRIKNLEIIPTDDSSIVEAAGIRPSYVLGDFMNIKITTPHDMLLAELLIKQLSLETSDLV